MTRETFIPQFLLKGMTPTHTNCVAEPKTISKIIPILSSADLYDVYKDSDGRAKCFCCGTPFDEDDWAFAAETGTCQYCHEDLIMIMED